MSESLPSYLAVPPRELLDWISRADKALYEPSPDHQRRVNALRWLVLALPPLLPQPEPPFDDFPSTSGSTPALAE